MAVLHCGHGSHEIAIVDLKTEQLTARVSIEEGFYGVAFSPQGHQLFASGAGQEAVLAWDFEDGLPSRPRRLALRPAKERGIPAGLAVAPDGRTLYVANVFGQSVNALDIERPEVTPRELMLGPRSAAPAADDQDPWRDLDDEAITKRARALLEVLNTEAPYPYACVMDPVHHRLYVSLWGLSAVEVIDLLTFSSVGRWKAEEHPNEMVLNRAGTRLFVANANRNTVSVLDTTTGAISETLTVELEPMSPPGVTPNSLALSPDESLLFVANADINAVAVFDLQIPGRSLSLGFIPVGWYPTSVRVTPDGRRLLVANGKGVASRANRHGPQPGRETANGTGEYIGSLFQGTQWSMAAYASDYVEKLWPLSYGHNRSRKYAYPSEGGFRISEPAGGLSLGPRQGGGG